jgi:guanyl-specific ribonuclease Sa
MVFFRLPGARVSAAAWGRLGAAAALCLIGAVGCTTPVEVLDPNAPATETPATEGPGATVDVSFGDVESPAGGTVKQLRLPGPESAVLVTCNQEGFTPFAYSDMGMDWVGCETATPSGTVELESSPAEPELSDVPGPVGGTVSQVTIPGPQSAISVLCETGSPFVYEDQGTWVGCEGS